MIYIVKKKYHKQNVYQVALTSNNVAKSKFYSLKLHFFERRMQNLIRPQNATGVYLTKSLITALKYDANKKCNFIKLRYFFVKQSNGFTS